MFIQISVEPLSGNSTYLRVNFVRSGDEDIAERFVKLDGGVTVVLNKEGKVSRFSFLKESGKPFDFRKNETQLRELVSKEDYNAVQNAVHEVSLILFSAAE